MYNVHTEGIFDISHFKKVHAFAALIGKMEGLDGRTQDISEIVFAEVSA